MLDNLEETKPPKSERIPGEPTLAFQGASWAALIISLAAYGIEWN